MFKKYLDMIRALVTPDLYLERLDEIDLEALYLKGYRTFFLDVDNTLVSYAETKVSLQKIQWVDSAKSWGFQVFLLSNNSSHRRIQKVASQLDLKGIYFAMKPLSYSVRELALTWNVDLKKSVFVGDKILTDVVVGNWVRGYSVLVDPLNKRDSFIRTLQRDFELYLLDRLKVALRSDQ